MAQLALPLQAHSLQTGENAHKKHDKLKELVTILQISGSQSPEFLSVLEAQHEKRKKVRSQYDESRKEQHQAMKMLHQETLEKLQSVLTDSQVDAFKAVMAQKHRKHEKKLHREGTKGSGI
jgi:hypothetical protein